MGGPGMAGGMGGPGMGSPGYKAAWYPSQSVNNSNSELGFIRQNLSGAYPVWRDNNDTVLMMAGIRNTLFFTDVLLPDTGQPFPEELWNISLGGMVIRKFENGWTGGFSATVGSASDIPFHSIREINVGLFGFLQVPARNERDSWIFSVMYSPVGNVMFPIPGIAYFWKPSDEFQMNIGLPFTVMWKPLDDLTFTFSYIPVINVNARATYRILPGLFVYGGFEWLNEAYFLADRINVRERFLGFEKRLVNGLRWELGAHTVLDLNAGYAFDRYYGEGQNQLSNLSNIVEVDPGVFIGANLLFKW